MTVLVCGGRDFGADPGDWPWMTEVLDDLDTEDEPMHLLINGGARGADQMSTNWALANGTPHRIFVADWKTHGKAAGFIRNQQMLDEGRPNKVVAFPGGNGTADMVRRAFKAGIDVVDLR